MNNVDKIADALIGIMTDPTLAINQLKRATTRYCARYGCHNTWRSKVSMLADKIYCSPECQEQARISAEQMIAQANAVTPLEMAITAGLAQGDQVTVATITGNGLRWQVTAKKQDGQITYGYAGTLRLMALTPDILSTAPIFSISELIAALAYHGIMAYWQGWEIVPSI